LEENILFDKQNIFPTG